MDMDVEVTVSGDLQMAFLEAYKNGVRRKIEEALGPDAEHVHVSIVGTHWHSLRAKVSGPEELVKKVKAALGQRET